MRGRPGVGVLGAIAAALLAVQAGGCGDSGDGDGIIEDRVTAGSFIATWDLVTVGGVPLGCGEVGADTVSFLFTDSLGQGYEDLFDCEAFSGETDPLPLDDFTVTVTLLDRFGATLGQTTLGPEDGASFFTCDFIDFDLCMVRLPLVEFVF